MCGNKVFSWQQPFHVSASPNTWTQALACKSLSALAGSAVFLLFLCQIKTLAQVSWNSFTNISIKEKWTICVNQCKPSFMLRVLMCNSVAVDVLGFSKCCKKIFLFLLSPTGQAACGGVNWDSVRFCSCSCLGVHNCL